MDVEQCWMRYLKAQELMEQGHWPEAHHLFNDVLSHLPMHIQSATEACSLKPCQFACLLRGLRDASIAQSEIYNRMGLHHDAFSTLNQTYALFQFLALESGELIDRLRSTLVQHTDALLSYMTAFCRAQRNAHWMLELEHVSHAHAQFSALHHYSEAAQVARVLN
ncbi:hypothetical protein BOO35_13790 [Vibrio navarrensis]|uniref:hypothetical protein n=1 Tax=Vibrio navarrensis TaxID=29495 RepID=UPI001867F6E4|nr:hypothetical protein [Vibrio navarrensis]EJK2115806.1 hypothetical protein [Vibrio navarrensis]MBE3666149.1 hypothetical protein [Vibrio navarrensis]